jgi:alpha-tubulin suppressor-like RCC1 family protein
MLSMAGTPTGTVRSSWLSLLPVIALAMGGCKESSSEVIAVALVEISVPAGPIKVGSSAQFTATAKDQAGQVITGRTVTWSTSSAAIATIDANGLLTALLAGTVSVLATVDGTSASVSITIIVPQPAVTNLSPREATIGSAGLTLTITGNEFVQGAVVRWNGQDRQTTFVSATQLSAQITAADLTSPGIQSVQVRNPPPGNAESSIVGFQVNIQVVGPFAAVRRHHTCVLDTDGDAFCWGRNDGSQLGDNTTIDRSIPTAVSTTSRFVAVGVGFFHGCALTVIGQARCWGANASGQLGDGTTTNRTTPAGILDGPAFTVLAVGALFTCGLDGQGKAWCWGANNFGQLGDGTTQQRLAPTPVTGSLSFRAISAGDSHTCGLTSANELYCWGFNGLGQLGQGDVAVHVGPVRVVTPSPIVMVTAGALHTCAIGQNGTTYCWGSNALGQIGIGTAGGAPTTTPAIIAGSFTFVAGGTDHTCGLLASGAAQCWGSNFSGQLGTGNMTNSNSPSAVQGTAAFRTLIAGVRTTCGVTAAGAMHCWGSRGFGELGDGQTAYRLVPTRVNSSGLSSVQTGVQFSCGLSSSGVARCWGINDFGQLGNGTLTNASLPTPVTGQASPNAEIAVGYYHACSRTGAGAVMCWGLGDFGRLGNGALTNRNVPTTVSGGQTYRSIAAGLDHTCGVTTTGQVQCWGRNLSGQLGTGNVTARNVPTAVVGVAGITFEEVTAGTFTTCARTTAGAVYCWGENDEGSVGDGTTTDRTQPVLINVGAPVARVSTRERSTCAVATTGTMFCWGSNRTGNLGTGSPPTPIGQLTPAVVTGGLTFASVRVGFRGYCGVTTTGGAFCWGENPAGQLGVGTLAINRSTPTQISGFGASNTFTIAAPGFEHSCGINNLDELACWGFDYAGELGLGFPGSVLSPQPVPGITVMIR